MKACLVADDGLEGSCVEVNSMSLLIRSYRTCPHVGINFYDEDGTRVHSIAFNFCVMLRADDAIQVDLAYHPEALRVAQNVL